MATTKEPLGPKSVALGATIRRMREQRGWDVRRTANATSSSIDQVNAWEEGQDVPTFAQWASLKGAVNHGLGSFTGLYHEARKEQGFVPSGGPPKALTVPLAEKLSAAITIAAAKAIPEKEEVNRGAATPGFKYPEGAKTAKARNERIEWARAQLRLRPHMPLNGPDGLKALVRSRFGVALSWDTMAELKEEVTGQAITEKEEVPTPVKVNVPTVNLGETFETAARLVLDAVPNLASFTITVDPVTGEAAVAYAIRQVQVVEQSGTITVGGRK